MLFEQGESGAGERIDLDVDDFLRTTFSEVDGPYQQGYRGSATELNIKIIGYAFDARAFDVASVAMSVNCPQLRTFRAQLEHWTA